MPKFGTRRVWAAVAAAATAVAIAVPVTGAQPAAAAPSVQNACAKPARVGWASCMAMVRTNVAKHKGLFAPNAAPSGYSPADLTSAYSLPSTTAGNGQTVAIVDAYDDPSAEADLATYRTQYGLPACTTANGCFRKAAQDGSTNYPAANSGWSEEISLDLDMVSAICPSCHILLMEANSADLDDLGIAVNEAVTLGAKYVSNSYGASEDPSETGYDADYNHPGVVVTASAGDAGFGTEYPAASPYVTSVGGTALSRDPSTARGWTEAAWGNASGGEGTGSGCSTVEPKPAWQSDTGCANRTVADVSAVADPNTGVAVYDGGLGGWTVFGGTSVAAPLIASVYALAGTPQAGTYPAEYPYDADVAGATALNDVAGGANGTCTPAYLCTGEPGYDGPTGLGTPGGTGAFTYRAHGDIAGTVTDTASGEPVAGAQVRAGSAATAVTDAQGKYDLSVPAADYPVTVSDYGYQGQTASATVTAGATTTKDFALTGTAHQTVSGKVTAGTGQPWPLYAEVTSDDGAGHTSVAYTDPATGAFSLSLLQSADYTLRITPLIGGYQPANEKISLGTSGQTENVGLAVDTMACTAIGYKSTLSGTTESFSGGTIPAGWQVTDGNLGYPGYTQKPGWQFTDPGGRANNTGGSGDFAVVDSDHAGPHHYQNTELVSPTLDMTNDTNPVVRFGTDLLPASNSTSTVDVSADGGKTWANVWRKTGTTGGDAGPATVVVPLPQAAGKAHIRVRFGYLGEWSQYWELDDVFLGNQTCAQQTGTLVVGRVSDAATDAGLNGATVTAPGVRATTAATPGDAVLNDGFYWLFDTATGSQQFTATMPGYTAGTVPATLTPGQVTHLNLPLTAT